MRRPHGQRAPAESGPERHLVAAELAELARRVEIGRPAAVGVSVALHPPHDAARGNHLEAGVRGDAEKPSARMESTPPLDEAETRAVGELNVHAV